MLKKWVIRIIAGVMILIMAVSVLYIAVGSLTAKAAVSQSQIDNLKKQQKDFQKKAQDIQTQINSLQYQQSTALAKKQVLDDQIQLTQDEIDNINEQIAEYDNLIAQKTVDVQKLQENEDAQLVKYKANMRIMEENGAVPYISVIFQANSFSDLLTRIDMVGDILQYDQNLYENLKADKAATIAAGDSLQTAKDSQETDKAELTTKQADLMTQVDASTQLLTQLQGDINTASDLYQQEVKSADDIQAQINAKVAQQKKEADAAAAAAKAAGKSSSGSSVKGTGKLIWPTPSCYIVTSPFGERHLFGMTRMHQGADIGAKYGATIIAADSGTVILSSYDSGGYGNYIVINHGNGITTLYGHMSSKKVKVGDTVKQGQVIGLVGATGDATGPHLHFEVSVNGTRVNPLQYFTGYTRYY